MHHPATGGCCWTKTFSIFSTTVKLAMVADCQRKCFNDILRNVAGLVPSRPIRTFLTWQARLKHPKTEHMYHTFPWVTGEDDGKSTVDGHLICILNK